MFSPIHSDQPCFALLDDGDADAASPRSRLYSQPVGSLQCRHVTEFPAFLQALQAALQQGRFAVSIFHYELGLAASGMTVQPGLLAQVLLFERCEHLARPAVDAWLAAQCAISDSPAGIANVVSDTDRAAFDTAMARIHDWIEAGDTYQVNYTYRLRFDAYGTLPALYARLRARQLVPYGALIAMPDGSGVLSLSPELFMRHENGRMTVQPMKGTAPASGDATRDAEAARVLASDAKNRAENLMIVDLLRNDLGRIAEIGSVQVASLFDVRHFSTVLQMTSTVHADLRSDIGLSEIFEALYPCGSITGAPKRRTMEIIHALETNPRGIYTGALGWFDPPLRQADALGDFCLSVPIRTLQLGCEVAGGIRHGEMGIGAGIVHDSVAADEYEECLLKARFLTGLSSEFQLFETMRASARQLPCLAKHMQRLQQSARYFGFAFDEVRALQALLDLCATLPDARDYRVRLALSHDGGVEITHALLQPLAQPVTLMLAAQQTSSDDLFLRHKTTVRTVYDAAWRDAEAHGAFDKLFFNEHDELTEGGRSSVFVRLDGRWYTPPLTAGLLPGVMRAMVLEDPVWQATERVITREQLLQAEQIMVCNALRGTLSAIFSEQGKPA